MAIQRASSNGTVTMSPNNAALLINRAERRGERHAVSWGVRGSRVKAGAQGDRAARGLPARQRCRTSRRSAWRERVGRQTKLRHQGFSQVRRRNIIFLLLSELFGRKRRQKGKHLLWLHYRSVKSSFPPLLVLPEAIILCLPSLSSWERLLVACDGCFIDSISCLVSNRKVKE